MFQHHWNKRQHEITISLTFLYIIHDYMIILYFNIFFDIELCELPRDCDVTVVNVGLVLKPVMTSQGNEIRPKVALGLRQILGPRNETTKIYCALMYYRCNYYILLWCILMYSDCVDRIWCTMIVLYGPLWPCMASYGFIILGSATAPIASGLASSALAEFMKSTVTCHAEHVCFWKLQEKNSLKAHFKHFLSSF